MSYTLLLTLFLDYFVMAYRILKLSLRAVCEADHAVVRLRMTRNVAMMRNLLLPRFVEACAADPGIPSIFYRVNRFTGCQQ